MRGAAVAASSPINANQQTKLEKENQILKQKI